MEEKSKGGKHQAHLFGLKPFTTYHVHVVAVNSAGQVSSPWTSVRTLEASPSGLSNFTVEKKENGRALLLKWSEPSEPNGIIKTYNIFSDDNLEYSGLSRQFLFRRLEPYTLYTLLLEACNAAGCTRSPPQPIRTDEAPPVSQMAPIIQAVNATNIELSWLKPINPNGKIIRYEVIHRCAKENAAGYRATMEDEKIVFTEYNTESNTFVYNDKGLQPWTSFDAATFNYTDEDLLPYSMYRPAETGKKTVDFDAYHSSFVRRSFIVAGLQPYSWYEVQLQACTELGCASSEWASVQTLEAPPAAQPAPLIEIQTTARGFQTVSSVLWTGPQQPNGKILHYELYRRRMTQALINLDLVLVYNGSSTFFRDDQLLPYTEYEYQIES